MRKSVLAIMAAGSAFALTAAAASTLTVTSASEPAQGSDTSIAACAATAGTAYAVNGVDNKVTINLTSDAACKDKKALVKVSYGASSVGYAVATLDAAGEGSVGPALSPALTAGAPSGTTVDLLASDDITAISVTIADAFTGSTGA